MSNEIKPIAISTREQVGHIIYRQRPSSKQLEDRELVMGDDYEEITYTGPGDRLAAIQEEVLNSIKDESEETTEIVEKCVETASGADLRGVSHYCVITGNRVNAGKLVAIRVTPYDNYRVPYYLVVSQVEGEDFVVVGKSNNAVTQMGGNEYEWQFDGIQLNGETIKICPVQNRDNDEESGNGLAVSYKDANDGSYIGYGNQRWPRVLNFTLVYEEEVKTTATPATPAARSTIISNGTGTSSNMTISGGSSSSAGKCVQTTLTSMNGGLWQLVVRTIGCYHNPLSGNDRLRW